MPFTASHAVAALPFLRTPLPASALVIGSMTPDLPYYLPLPAVPTHTAGAVVTHDLLLGLAAWALWHGLLAAPALAAAPAGLRARLAGVPLGLAVRVPSSSRMGWVVAALVLGAGIHVLWDEFTHPRRWGAENIPALNELWGPFPLHFWLQHLCGLAGGVVLLVWFVRWWRRTPAGPASPARGTWWVWTLLVVVGGIVGGAAAASAPSLDLAGFRGVTSGGGAVLIAAVLYAIAWQAESRHARRGPEPYHPKGPPGSRVVALAAALLLGVVCFLLGLFALWPPMPGEDPGLVQALPEVLLLGVAGLGTAGALRWALGLHQRSAVVLGWLLGLTPCLLVSLELLRR